MRSDWFWRWVALRRIGGVLALVGGVLAMLAPFFSGEWAIALLGLLLVGLGIVKAGQAFSSPGGTVRFSAFLPANLAILAGLLLFARPMFVLSGLLTVIALLLIADGLSRAIAAFRERTGRARRWSLADGLVIVLLGLLVWYQRSELGIVAIGLILGLYILSSGWAMLLAPADDLGEAALAEPPDTHPDARLGLQPHEEFRRLRAAVEAAEPARNRRDIYWVLMLAFVFFAIHVGRMGTDWTWLSLVSPFIAVLGDLAACLLLAGLVMVPLFLSWRRVTRPIERSAWRERLERDGDTETWKPVEWAMRHWLDRRLRLALRLRAARASVGEALWAGLKLGLPVVAVFVAINPIWGFTWYFNTENWASGFWDKVVEIRVDRWRERMTQAIEARYLGQGSRGVSATTIYSVTPDGVTDAANFSFLVIGDPGEGDPSQYSLQDTYLEVGRRPDVKFLVISSDVIYPAGEMRDYEFNFYLPFKGFTKPIYAIPGNHDYYDGLDGFLANFLEPAAAREAIRARVATDFGLSGTTETVITDSLGQAQRLRALYRVRTGLQRGPYFEMHTRGFSLIAVDTGILKRIDKRQMTWLEAALQRARGNFRMVLLGHPLYAGGVYQGATNPPFAAIHRLLTEHEVELVMAGDTHDFEYYREEYTGKSGPLLMHHFVNGGGGAYLSIGTALAWPAKPPVPDWAFYPRTDSLTTKLDVETPTWKRPIWLWIKNLGAWPASVEALSAFFDFNHAPFFQSFMEVRVEGSRGRVRLILHGVNGPLPWRDLQVGGAVVPVGQGMDDPVEFVIPMRQLTRGDRRDRRRETDQAAAAFDKMLRAIARGDR
ncbi:MAG TPA: metallophosphoesterase [Candidatus Methylomirabilis sp.]|nr:metallophosphoesterase [Candidatus Methylomirabilis sp.]